jgi:hypothetical protein
LKWLRRDLAAGQSKTVVRLLDLLHKYGALSPDELHELTRTPAVRRVLNGISKSRRSYWGATFTPASPPVAAPTPVPNRGYWKRHWSQRNRQ